ncbi:hypothetical protein SAMN04489812_3651 [Microlunatus soli]|uniref:Uncharacterized protein n=1 Tax=Microlunatus soli TaxID=630515 RepID=A0A1H1WH64_9ACTN|nr:hypothetical protein SAMN04489812_3651 [Microlunatus soli]
MIARAGTVPRPERRTAQYPKKPEQNATRRRGGRSPRTGDGLRSRSFDRVRTLGGQEPLMARRVEVGSFLAASGEPVVATVLPAPPGWVTPLTTSE